MAGQKAGFWVSRINVFFLKAFLTLSQEAIITGSPPRQDVKTPLKKQWSCSWIG